MQATFVKKMKGRKVDARLYRLSEPYAVVRGNGARPVATGYVVISAVGASGAGPLTYIFPANAEGSITSYGALDGSFRGAFDHARALAGFLESASRIGAQ